DLRHVSLDIRHQCRGGGFETPHRAARDAGAQERPDAEDDQEGEDNSEPKINGRLADGTEGPDPELGDRLTHGLTPCKSVHSRDSPEGRKPRTVYQKLPFLLTGQKQLNHFWGIFALNKAQSSRAPPPPPSSYRPPVSSGAPQAGGPLLAGDLPRRGDDIGRRSIELRNQGRDLRAGHRRDEQPLPPGIGKEFRVLDGSVEGRAQRPQP